jgi:uncharacterized protein YndB with AHSA1/START domain
MQSTASPKTVAYPTLVERTSDRELVVTRTFRARPQTVFDAWTKPELLARWWAPRSLGVTLFSCEADVRVGGRYRYVFGRDPKQAMAFSGVYREVVPGSRVVVTQLFEQMPQAGEAVVTAAFEAIGAETRLVLHQHYPTKEALEGAIASGMEHGMRNTFDQLGELVVSLSST